MVIGALGGGVLGHHAERRIRGEARQEAGVRLDDGSLRTFTRDTAWPLQAGERVRIVDDTLAAVPRGAGPIREAVYVPGG